MAASAPQTNRLDSPHFFDFSRTVEAQRAPR